MSVQHIALVLEAADLCAQEKAVLTAFCNHTDPSGKTFAGEERLMREAGMPRSTFQRWRSTLVKRELLFSRRRGRKGGGRTTSDTYVNIARLRAMRDPYFGNVTADQPDDENPFSQADSNGPASEAKGSTHPSNGPVSEGINGPASEGEPAPPVRPITLLSPQGEPSTPSPAPTASAAPTVVADRKEGEGDPLPKNDTDPAAVSMAQRLPGDVTQVRRRKLAAQIAKLIGAGWGAAALERELSADLGGVQSHYAVYKRRMTDLADLAPIADKVEVDPAPTTAPVGLTDEERLAAEARRIAERDERRRANTRTPSALRSAAIERALELGVESDAAERWAKGMDIARLLQFVESDRETQAAAIPAVAVDV